MKKIASILAAAMLSFTCTTAVNADWRGSATQLGGVSSSASGTITASNGTTVSAGQIVVTPASKADERTQEVASVVTESGSNSIETMLSNFGGADAAMKAIEEQAAEKGITISNLKPVAAFDVTLVGITLSGGETIDIPVKVDGISKGDKVIAIHFSGEVGNLTADVIPSSVDDNGNVVLTMSSFSPVLILKDTSTTGTGTNSTVPSTGVYSNVAVWAGVLVVAAVAAGIVLYSRKRKAH